MTVSPTVESVKKALFTNSRLPAAANHHISNTGKSSTSSSTCSTPISMTTNVSASIVANKQPQNPTTFASVTPVAQSPVPLPIDVAQKPPISATPDVSTRMQQSQVSPVTFNSNKSAGMFKINSGLYYSCKQSFIFYRQTDHSTRATGCTDGVS